MNPERHVDIGAFEAPPVYTVNTTDDIPTTPLLVILSRSTRAAERRSVRSSIMPTPREEYIMSRSIRPLPARQSSWNPPGYRRESPRPWSNALVRRPDGFGRISVDPGSGWARGQSCADGPDNPRLGDRTDHDRRRRPNPALRSAGGSATVAFRHDAHRGQRRVIDGGRSRRRHSKLRHAARRRRAAGEQHRLGSESHPRVGRRHFQ